jgi:hypothetical protein
MLSGGIHPATHHKPWFKRLINTRASIPRSDSAEYIHLHDDIELWAAEYIERKAHTYRLARQPANEPLVPTSIKLKLQRLAAIRQELAQAACAQAEDLISVTRPETQLRRFFNAFAKRVNLLGWQRRAMVADMAAGGAVGGTVVDGAVANAAAGDAVGGDMGVSSASTGGRRSRQGHEGDEDKCLICCGGGPTFLASVAAAALQRSLHTRMTA